jgi:hypothetical protein
VSIVSNGGGDPSIVRNHVKENKGTRLQRHHRTAFPGKLLPIVDVTRLL